MENRVTEQEVNDQGAFTDELDESGNQFEDLGDFLDHVELGVLVAIRRGRVYEIHGGKPYERIPNTGITEMEDYATP